MRVWIVAGLLGGIFLTGVAATRTSAQGQNLQAGLTSGETVSIASDANAAGTECVVLEVRGDFLGCGATASSRGLEHWYNLRLVARIDKRPAKP
jgi:hypothetical protein